MTIANTIILSLTVCIDSFLLCLLNKTKSKFIFLITPLIFSFFQILFLLGGYFVGDFLEIYIHNCLKYIVFIIFSSLGVKLIIDTLLNKGKEKTCFFALKDIIFQAITTSCDSLFLGVPLAFSTNQYLTLTITIGITTFFICLLGLILRTKITSNNEEKITLAGAIILFLFAFKSLL